MVVVENFLGNARQPHQLRNQIDYFLLYYYLAIFLHFVFERTDDQRLIVVGYFEIVRFPVVVHEADLTFALAVQESRHGSFLEIDALNHIGAVRAIIGNQNTAFKVLVFLHCGFSQSL